MNWDYIFAFIILAVFVALMLFVGYKGYKKSKSAKNRKEIISSRLGAALSGTLIHKSGLPIAKGLAVEVFYCPDKFVFKKDGQEVTVSREKVTSVDVIVASGTARKALSGAATGKYVLGGKTGAVVGAATAIKTQMVISYVSDGKNKSIVLDTANSGLFASKVKKDFDKTKVAKRTTIEL